MLAIHIADAGWDPGDYLDLWFASTPSSQLFVDLAIASFALFAWAAFDGPRIGLRRWWVCIPGAFLVGLCFALPLYLYLRERQLEGAPAS